MDHHCHCPPVDHHAHYSPPPCDQQGSSWNTPDHCHPPCPPCPAAPPPPYEPQPDYFWNPAFQPTPFPRTWSSSSSDAGDAPSCTVSVEKPPAAGGKKAPLLETKIHGDAAAGPSGLEALFVLVFCAVVGGFIYWCWF
ncbi:unnamed protein product [Urochloa humidicola]